MTLAGLLSGFLTPAAVRGEEFPFSDGWRFRAGDAPLAKSKLYENILTRRMARVTGTDLLASPYKKGAETGWDPLGAERFRRQRLGTA